MAEKTATGEGIFTALTQIASLNDALGGAGTPPAQIVVESDGKETVPEDPDDPRGGFTAARAARAAGVPVNTISFGTATGTVVIDGDRIPVPVANEPLRKIAELSGGSFYTAESLDELTKVYDELQEQIGYENRRGDHSKPWLIAGTILLILASATAISLDRRFL